MASAVRPQPRSIASSQRSINRSTLRRASFAAASSASSSAPASTSSTLLFKYVQIEKVTQPGISLFDITPDIKAEVQRAGLQEGVVHVLSRHTTTAVTINEAEPRLMDDIRQWLRKLAPPSDPYLHNDLHVREAPEGWPGGHAAWVKQEPINAHSHLLSIMIGNTQSIPVSGGKLCLGTWQSVLLVELDGPRTRSVGIQLTGQVGQQPSP